MPSHLQHLIFASAAAPLTTCKASSAIASDASLVETWLLVKHKQPLLTAIKHELWDACDRLLGSHHYTPGNEELHVALNKAALAGSVKVVSSILQWCCNEHHQHPNICMLLDDALLCATMKGHVPVVSLLIKHPAITAQHYRHAVIHAACYGQLQVLQLLVTTRPDASYAAARCGHLEVIKWLHDQGMTHIEGEALQAAAHLGHAPIIQYLIQECGADVSLFGVAALMIACMTGKSGVVCVLLEAGTPSGGPFIMQALQQGHSGFNSVQLDDILRAATQHGHPQLADLLRLLREARPARSEDGV
jgi:hypothetical protein